MPEQDLLKDNQLSFNFETPRTEVDNNPLASIPSIFKESESIGIYYPEAVKSTVLLPILLDRLSPLTLKLITANFRNSSDPKFESLFSIQQLAMNFESTIREGYEKQAKNNSREMNFSEYATNWLNSWQAIPLSTFLKDREVQTPLYSNGQNSNLRRLGLLTTLDMLVLTELGPNNLTSNLPPFELTQAENILKLCDYLRSTIPEWLKSDFSAYPAFLKLPKHKRDFIQEQHNWDKVASKLNLQTNQNGSLLAEYGQRGNIGMPIEATRRWRGATAVGVGMHSLASKRFGIEPCILETISQVPKIAELKPLLTRSDLEQKNVEKQRSDCEFDNLWYAARRLVQMHSEFLQDIPLVQLTHAEVQESSPANQILNFLLEQISTSTSDRALHSSQRIDPFQFGTSKYSETYEANLDLLTSAFIILMRETRNPTMQQNGVFVPEVQLDGSARCDISIVEAPEYIDLSVYDIKNRIKLEAFDEEEDTRSNPRTSWHVFYKLIQDIERQIEIGNNGDKLAVELVEIKTQLSPKNRLPLRGKLPHRQQLIRAANSLKIRYGGDLPLWYKGSRLIYFSPRGVTSFFYPRGLIDLKLHVNSQSMY